MNRRQTSRHISYWMATFGLLLGLGHQVSADDSPAIEDPDMAHWNVNSKTLGGRQFWGDVQFFHDWRIQQNVFTGHYRLLDGRDVRHGWGSLAECREKLEAIKQQQDLKPMSGKAVILLHGIFRSSKSMLPLRAALQKDGYSVFAMDYPSTRGTVQESAEYLKRTIESLEGITEINFIVHSMGGIVVRTYLQQAERPDPRIARMVMLGSPNTGADLVDMLKNRLNFVFKPLYGPAGQQLATGPDGFVAKLPIPKFEFAVIAGGRNTEAGYNPLIPGDDDGVVSVASTRLPGATDFLLVSTPHTFMMLSPEISTACLLFLKSGSLRSDGTKEPIPQLKDSSDDNRPQ